jgi:rhodanese-related sulfurtransferase
MSGWPGGLFRRRPRASAKQAGQIMREGAILLDVREGPEWRAGHAPGARHIPLSHLPAQMKDLPPRRTVVTVCRSGHRSALAARMLAASAARLSTCPGECTPGRAPGSPWSPPAAAPAGWREPVTCRRTYTLPGILRRE